MKGFTLIEIIFSITIAGILIAIATNSFQIAQLKKQQQGIAQSLAAYLEEQKTNTQSGKEGLSYGIKFNASDFTLFKGTTYAQSSSTNKIIALDPQFQITESISNAENILSFSKIYGTANETATITISHITDRVSPKMVTINTAGAISVIE